jgi:hypothetical protein
MRFETKFRRSLGRKDSFNGLENCREVFNILRRK